MPWVDRSDEFRQSVAEAGKAIVDPKRQKNLKRGHEDEERRKQSLLNKEYMTQGYNILTHLTTLTRMLNSIRRVYLNVDSRDGLLSRKAGSKPIDVNDGDQAWTNIHYLTNEERDQIDMQAKVILSRCAERVREMETLEKRRQEAIGSKARALLRILPTRLKLEPDDAASDFLAVHNSSITWYLNRRLAQTSQAQKELQEERIKRQTERTRTLGSGAAREAVELGMGFGDGLSLVTTQASQKIGSGSWLEGATSTLASAVGSPYASEGFVTEKSYGDLSEDEDDEDMELSQSQIQQFEEENAQILKSVQDTLFAVQQAESRLLDISALQMELVVHLTRQSELTDQLYEDAIATTYTVERGNIQLREARRRARDSRMWILLFLTGASLSLLFLHYY